MNKAKLANERQLTVGYATTEKRKAGKLQTAYKSKILLQGNWLEKAGFTIGEFIKVIVADGFIQIINSTTPQPVEEKPEREVNEHAEEDFRGFLDSLHFDGYSEDLMYSHPDQFTELYNQYIFDYARTYR